LSGLSAKVLLIAKRYEHTLGEIESRTEVSRGEVMAALERMGYTW
jgi:N-6 DNA methylase